MPSATDRLRDIDVLYQEDDLIAVAKPAGLPVHGGAQERRTLIEIMRQALGRPVDLVHRIDAATSGVVLLSSSKPCLRALQKGWGEVDKRYLCLCAGRWSGPAMLQTSLSDPQRGALSAHTEVEPVAVLDGIEPPTTLLFVRLHTGRKHQIRRHLSQAGHPVLLDDKYGDFALTKAWRRATREAGAPPPRKGLMLHAARVTFPHPTRGDPVTVAAPLPRRWEAIIRAGAGQHGEATIGRVQTLLAT